MFLSNESYGIYGNDDITILKISLWICLLWHCNIMIDDNIITLATFFLRKWLVTSLLVFHFQTKDSDTHVLAKCTHDH